MVSTNMKSTKGVAILELVIILPLLVLVVLVGIDYSRALQRMQIAAALSREAASIGYREFVADPAGDPTRSLQMDPAAGNATTYWDELDAKVKNAQALIDLRNSTRRIRGLECVELRINVLRSDRDNNVLLWKTLSAKDLDLNDCTSDYIETLAKDNPKDLSSEVRYTPPGADGPLDSGVENSPLLPPDQFTYMVIGEAHVPFSSLAYIPWMRIPEFYDASVLFQIDE